MEGFGLSALKSSATYTACFFTSGLFSSVENEFDSSILLLPLLGEAGHERFLAAGTEKPSSPVCFLVTVMIDDDVSILIDLAPLSSGTLTMGRGSEEGTGIFSVMSDELAGEGEGSCSVRSGRESEEPISAAKVLFAAKISVLNTGTLTLLESDS